jgi:hypothetical protein
LYIGLNFNGYAFIAGILTAPSLIVHNPTLLFLYHQTVNRNTTYDEDEHMDFYLFLAFPANHRYNTLSRGFLTFALQRYVKT